MSRRLVAPEVIESLGRFHRGRLELVRAQRAHERRTSPKAVAGRIGGRVTAELYPVKARDQRGRFTSAPSRDAAPPAPRPSRASNPPQKEATDRRRRTPHAAAMGPAIRAGPHPT